jgi:hypothetical protein
VQWQVGQLIAVPGRLRGAKTSPFGAQELIISAVSDKHGFGAFDAKPLHRFKVDVWLRLCGADIERKHRGVEELCGAALWPSLNVFGETVADDGEFETVIAQLAKHGNGLRIESREDRRLLETTFFAEAVHGAGIERSAKCRADVKQGVSK